MITRETGNIKLSAEETKLWETDGPDAEHFRRDIRETAYGHSEVQGRCVIEISSHDGIVLDAIRAERKPAEGLPPAGG
jgi:hypothetical protein